MNNFFEKSDISRSEAENIVSDTLSKCDDGELYLENTKSETLLLDDNKIKNSSYNSDLGFGFRAISDEIVAYSHSNEISKNSLRQSSENLKSTLKSVKGTYNHEIPKSNKKYYDNINPIEQKSLNEKIKILNEVNNYLRSKDNNIKQVTANFLGEQKSVEIIRSGGESLTDVRPLIRFNVSVMLEKNGRKESGVYGVGGRQSYDFYLKDENWKSVCDEALRIASVNLESKPAPAGEMKVVLGPGWPAILIHELILLANQVLVQLSFHQLVQVYSLNLLKLFSKPHHKHFSNFHLLNKNRRIVFLQHHTHLTLSFHFSQA